VLRDLRIVFVSWFIVNTNFSWTLQFTSSGRKAIWYCNKLLLVFNS